MVLTWFTEFMNGLMRIGMKKRVGINLRSVVKVWIALNQRDERGGFCGIDPTKDQYKGLNYYYYFC